MSPIIGETQETIVNEDFWPHWFYSALELDRKPCLFTDLVGSDGYIEMTQLAKIQTAINVACELMNEKSEEEGLPPVEIIPFKFTVVHLFRVCRILKDTRDHLCLTGQASTGAPGCACTGAFLKVASCFVSRPSS